MKTKQSLVILVALLLALVTLSSSFLAGCSSTPAPAKTNPASSAAPSTQSSPASTQAANGTNVIRWGAAQVTGTSYILSAGMADLINKYTDYKTNVSPYAGIGAILHAMYRGEIDFGMGGANEVYNAYNGVADFAKDGKLGVNDVAMGFTTTMAFVGQPGINTIPDLKGKIFMYRRPTNMLWGEYGDAVLKAYGLGPDTVKIVDSTDTNTLLDDLKTGTIDAGMVPGNTPNSRIMQLMQVKNFSLINVDKDKLVAISKEYPNMIPLVIPAGTYKGQTEAINSMGYGLVVFCRADLPAQEVYDVTKAVYDHLDQFSAVAPAAKQFTLKGAVEHLTIPLDPGAQKYFQEAGVLSK